MTDKLFVAWVVFLIFVGTIGGAYTIGKWNECNDQRGVFVKTAFWYDCIEKGKH